MITQRDCQLGQVVYEEKLRYAENERLAKHAIQSRDTYQPFLAAAGEFLINIGRRLRSRYAEPSPRRTAQGQMSTSREIGISSQ